MLHIGTEKTATTLIQRWLYGNEAVLSRHGIALTRASAHPNNRKLVSFLQGGIDDYLRRHDVHRMPERETFFAGYPEAFDAEIGARAGTHHTAILTSEHFHSRLAAPDRIAALKAFLDRSFSSYRIVCYFREQSKLRTSLYSTALKVGHTQTVEDFHADAAPGSPYYDYGVFLRRWEDVFGRDALRPRLFDAGWFAGGDIRTDFLQVLDPDIAPGDFDFREASANTSLTRLDAILYRIVNLCRSEYVGRLRDPIQPLLKAAVARSGAGQGSGPVSDPRQAAFHDLFHASNVTFFGRYFGTAENLFPRPADPRDVAELRLDEAALEKVLTAVLSERSLVAIRPGEVDFLRDLAIGLHQAGHIPAGDAVRLLAIAHRARPGGAAIGAAIEALSARPSPGRADLD